MGVRGLETRLIFAYVQESLLVLDLVILVGQLAWDSISGQAGFELELLPEDVDLSVGNTASFARTHQAVSERLNMRIIIRHQPRFPRVKFTFEMFWVKTIYHFHFCGTNRPFP